MNLLSLKPMIISLIIILFIPAYSDGVTSFPGNENSHNPTLNLKIGAVFGVSTISMIKLFKEKPSLGKNVTTEYETITSPDQVAAKVISGELDIVMVASNLGAKLYNKGVPFKLAGAMVWGNLYVVSKTRFKDWEDLKGKEIFLHARGLTPDFVFRHLLQINGLDPVKDVKLTYLSGGPQALAMSFLGGRSAISIMPEPMLTKIRQRQEKINIVIDIQKEWQKATQAPHSGFPQGALLIKTTIIKKYPEVVARFLQEYEKSIDWINQNPILAGEYAESLDIGMNSKVVSEGVPGCNLRYVKSEEAQDALNTLFTILFRFNPNAVGGKIPDKELYIHNLTQ